jgi:Raf kinase inhibitor-like YbhB/YbcL family protein
VRLTSPAFDYGRMIPVRFTVDGDNVSPPLVVDDLPTGTTSLALIVEDPDVEGGTWVHWVAYDIDPAASIGEGVEDLGTPGHNSWRRRGYEGPKPPTGMHRYLFRVYALDCTLRLPEDLDRRELDQAMEGHVLADAALMGRYGR